MTWRDRPDELDDPARAAPPPVFVPIENGMELMRVPAMPDGSMPPMLDIFGVTPFGEYVMTLRSGTEADIPGILASCLDGFYEKIIRCRPVEESKS